MWWASGHSGRGDERSIQPGRASLFLSPLPFPPLVFLSHAGPKTISGGEARCVYVGVPQWEAPLSGEVGPRTQPCWVPKLEPVRGVPLRCKGAEEVED